MKVTIKDIAKKAGVSPATVSKIINNYQDVGEETKKRVLHIMQIEGYQPSVSTKAQQPVDNKLIGVVFAGEINADLTHPVFVEVINEFKKAIGELGYDLIFFSNEQFFSNKESYIERCKHFNISGCLLIAGDRIEKSVYELDISPIPCVGVDLALQGPSSSYVTSDSMSIASKVVEHLYLRGHREIGYIGGSMGSLVSNSRLESFQAMMKQYGLLVNEDWIREGDFFEESGYQEMKAILAQPKRPTAIFASSDLMAIGAIRAAKEAGLSIPEDLSVVGCDDILPAQFIDPPLTTIRQDKKKLGKLAAHILEDLIHQRIQSSSVTVEPELVVRHTTSNVML